MEHKDLKSALLALLKAGYNIEYPILAQVISVNSSDKIVKVKSGEEVIPNVKYYAPVTPGIGSNALIVFRNNIHDRSVALAFDKFDAVEMIITQKANILIDSEEFTVTYDDDKKITLKDDILKLEYGENLSISLSDDGISMEVSPSDYVNIGSGVGNEFIALGEKLKLWLEGFIDVLTNTPIVTDPESGALSATPALSSALDSAKDALATILSKNVKAS